jgi:hypothetical protein
MKTIRLDVGRLTVDSFFATTATAALTPPTLQTACNPASDAGGLTCGMTDCTCRLDYCK